MKVKNESELYWIFTLPLTLITKAPAFYHLYEVTKFGKQAEQKRLSSRLAQLISKFLWFLTVTQKTHSNLTQESGIKKHLVL